MENIITPLSDCSLKDIFFENQKVICAITGHYGSGKSFFSVNLALMLKQAFPNQYVSMTDLDIVNPYFRSADSEQLLCKNQIEVIRQEYANSNVDLPSVPAELNKIFERDGKSVLDIGGDDSGAIVLGTIAHKLKSYGFYHFFVVSFCRPRTSTPKEAYECLKQIETTANLPVTHIINNTNLGDETTSDILLSSVEKAKELAFLCGLEHKLYHTCAKANFNPPDSFISMHDYTKKYFK